LSEILSESRPGLGLIITGEAALAIDPLRWTDEFFVEKTANWLIVAENNLGVVRTDFEDGRRATDLAFPAVAESRVEEAGKVSAKLAARRIMGGHLRGKERRHPDVFDGGEDVERILDEDEVGSRELDRLEETLRRDISPREIEIFARVVGGVTDSLGA
jgi:hypothetical protein